MPYVSLHNENSNQDNQPPSAVEETAYVSPLTGISVLEVHVPYP